ncbi:mitochondrial import receptor subunit TOM40 homolog 1 [Bacillus rossius redtenbacheri]|uniref:mitochondrial import receptor subunit TOM40 homolog 1 n=1 Tax=Bacillus rossius redtenbacheri TaxID=93214 RepID=UPI002FDD38B0
MGNKVSFCEPLHSGPGTKTLPPPPPPTVGIIPDKDYGKQETDVQEAGPGHPGTMEDLHKKCKDVHPVVFEGAKFMVNKVLSNHFQISHTLNLSSFGSSGYRFGATYVGTHQVSPSEVFPVFVGDIDAGANLNANVIHQFGQRLRAKFGAQIQGGQFAAGQLTTDYRGGDYTASLTLGNIDLVHESGVVVAHYLQKVAPRLDAGAELVYQYGPSIPGREIAVTSVAGRYNGDDVTLSATLGSAGVHACYYQRASDQLKFGVELEMNSRIQECVATVGFQADVPKADLTFRGMVDSNWTVAAVLEKKLQPLPFTFALSGTLNHAKSQFRVGCGLIIG